MFRHAPLSAGAVGPASCAASGAGPGSSSGMPDCVHVCSENLSKPEMNAIQDINGYYVPEIHRNSRLLEFPEIHRNSRSM